MLPHETTSVALIKFPLTAIYVKSQRVLLNITVDSIVGNQSSRVVVLGVRNPSYSLTPTSVSWNSLSTFLNPLPSGTVITNIGQNFINWTSNANLAVAGASQLNFLLYRPFRNKQYSPPGGIIPADDLSSGSLIRINGANSANPPQLSYYNTN